MLPLLRLAAVALHWRLGSFSSALLETGEVLSLSFTVARDSLLDRSRKVGTDRAKICSGPNRNLGKAADMPDRGANEPTAGLGISVDQIVVAKCGARSTAAVLLTPCYPVLGATPPSGSSLLTGPDGVDVPGGLAVPEWGCCTPLRGGVHGTGCHHQSGFGEAGLSGAWRRRRRPGRILHPGATGEGAGVLRAPCVVAVRVCAGAHH